MLFYIKGILALAMINIIAVLGVTVFTGFTGLFSLGHAAFIASGAYTAAILTHFYHWNFYAALAAAALVSGLLSLVIGIPTLRAKLRSDYFAIATLGFGEAFKMILENLDITQGARGLPGIDPYATFPVILVMTVLAIVVTANFVFSKYGRQAVAAREDYTAAEMMGINLFRVQLRSLFFSAVLAGVRRGPVRPLPGLHPAQPVHRHPVVHAGDRRGHRRHGQHHRPDPGGPAVRHHPRGPENGQHVAHGHLRRGAGGDHGAPPPGHPRLPGNHLPGHPQPLLPPPQGCRRFQGGGLAMANVLEVKNLTKHFGGIVALP